MVLTRSSQSLLQLCILAAATVAVGRPSIANTVKAACYTCISDAECDKTSGGVSSCTLANGHCNPSSTTCGS